MSGALCSGLGAAATFAAMPLVELYTILNTHSGNLLGGGCHLDEEVVLVPGEWRASAREIARAAGRERAVDARLSPSTVVGAPLHPAPPPNIPASHRPGIQDGIGSVPTDPSRASGYTLGGSAPACSPNNQARQGGLYPAPGAHRG